MLREDYIPHDKTAKILDQAYQLVNSVPYQVSARWLFYRLLQEGWYSKKSDYSSKFLKAISTARHAFYGDWRPDTLADDTREAIIRGRGVENVGEWLDSLSKSAVCTLDKWIGQENYVELWFEARAMADQFKHYTQYITLRPMGGQPSIPYKWKIAKDLERCAENYDAPIVILYFGDLDNAGEMISWVVERDIGEWCDEPFEFVHCGLNADQVQKYNVPENPEKPGQYQWEALPDQAAREIITSNVQNYLRHDAFLEIENREQRVTEWFRNELFGLAKRWK